MLSGGLRVVLEGWGKELEWLGWWLLGRGLVLKVVRGFGNCVFQIASESFARNSKSDGDRPQSSSALVNF